MKEVKERENSRVKEDKSRVRSIADKTRRTEETCCVVERHIPRVWGQLTPLGIL